MISKITTMLLLLVLVGCANSSRVQAPRLAPMEKVTLTPLIKVQPNYPKALLKKGIEGWVLYEVEIGNECKVAVIRLVDASPPNGFDSESTRRVVGKWCYKPATGVEHEKTMALVEFRLQ